MTLDDLAAGVAAQITSIGWDKIGEEDAKRLQALGFEEGAAIEAVHRGVFGGSDPLAIRLGKMKIALRRAHAVQIEVAPQ